MSITSFTSRPHFSPDESPALTRAELLGWAAVQTALGQVVYGAAFLSVGVFVAVVFAQAALKMFGPLGLVDAGTPGTVGIVLLALLFLLGAALVFIGMWTCCEAPTKFDGRGLSIAAIFCLMLWLAFLLLGIFLGPSESERRALLDQQDFGGPAPAVKQRPGDPSNLGLLGKMLRKAIPYASQATFLLAGVCFVHFLRATAAFAGNYRLHGHMNVFLTAYVTFSLALGVFNYLTGKSPPLMEHPGYLRGVWLIMASLLGWFAVVTGSVRASLARTLLTRKEADALSEIARHKPSLSEEQQAF